MPQTPGLAQTGTPSSATQVSSLAQSITRAEYLAELRRHFSIEPPMRRGGHVLMAISDNPASLNPMLAGDFESGLVMGTLYNGLVQPSLIDGNWVPDLADAWEMSDDGATCVFHLHPRATWHDGQPVTAHDCVFTFDAMLDETGLSPFGSEVASVTRTYRAIDDHTFELTAHRPVANLFDKSAGQLAILPKHVWESIPYEEWGAAPGSIGTDPSRVVGSGPYRFGEWALGEHVTVVRNDAYWVPEMVPSLDAFTWRILPEESAALQALRAGDIDTCNVPAVQVAALRESLPNHAIETYDDLGRSNFTLNGDAERSPLFVDARVRQAMLYALDRDLMIDSLLDGYGVRADGIYPPPSPVHSPERITTIYTYDPDRSRMLLDEAGWIATNPDGIREQAGVTFRAEFLYIHSHELSRQIATYVQQAWREIGLDVQPRAVAGPELFERLASGDFDAALNGWGGLKDDQGFLYRCDAMPPDGVNFQRICNPEFDRLNEASVFELDPARRRELLIEQGNIVNDDAHLGLLFFRQLTYATHPRVRNFLPSPYTTTWPLSLIWIDEQS